MDFIEALPKSEGKEGILVVVDRLSKYAHFLALTHPYTTSSVAKAFMKKIYKLHGRSTDIISYRGSGFINTFWQEFMKRLKVQLKLSTSYHLQTDGQTEVVNHSVEPYLCCMIGDFPTKWVQWLPLAEWWYNTSYHSVTGVSTYEVLYGKPPPTHLPYLASSSPLESVDRNLSASERIIQHLKGNLARDQARMKLYADKTRSECTFSIGNWVYLKL